MTPMELARQMANDTGEATLNVRFGEAEGGKNMGDWIVEDKAGLELGLEVDGSGEIVGFKEWDFGPNGGFPMEAGMRMLFWLLNLQFTKEAKEL